MRAIRLVGSVILKAMTDDISTSPAEPRTSPADPGTGPAPSPATGLAPQDSLVPPPPWLQRWEIVAVFAVSLGASGLYALVSLIGSLTAKQSLSKQTATLNGSLAPGRPLLDLVMQLLNITLSLAPVLLVFSVLAPLIGGTGLGLYLIAYHLGVELNVVPESLPDVWWRFPVLLLSAAQNA